MTNVYLIKSIDRNRTYIGVSIDVLHRLDQHNGKIAGGAKATRGHKWEIVCIVCGFPTRKSALQLEWRLHRRGSRHKDRKLARIKDLSKALYMDQWTKTAIPTINLYNDLYIIWNRDSDASLVKMPEEIHHFQLGV